MGNTASGGRERQKSGDASMSPRDGHAFEFGTKHGMHEGEPYVLRQKHVLVSLIHAIITLLSYPSVAWCIKSQHAFFLLFLT
jgi:hypothetical protein